MTAKIRGDLVGVVHVYLPDAQTVVLAAGDEVPAGAEVGEHLLAPEAEKPKKPSSTAKQS